MVPLLPQTRFLEPQVIGPHHWVHVLPTGCTVTIRSHWSLLPIAAANTLSVCRAIVICGHKWVINQQGTVLHPMELVVYLVSARWAIDVEVLERWEAERRPEIFNQTSSLHVDRSLLVIHHGLVESSGRRQRRVFSSEGLAGLVQYILHVLSLSLYPQLQVFLHLYYDIFKSNFNWIYMKFYTRHPSPVSESFSICQQNLAVSS